MKFQTPKTRFRCSFPFRWGFLWFLSFGLGVSAAPRVPWTSNRVVGSPNPPAPYAVARLHPQLTFNNPLDVAFAPWTERLFVAEQGGKLWSFDVRSNAAKADLAIDLRQHHKPFDNILGFTFHPGFAANRFVFINYNETPGRPEGAHVSRFTVRDEPPTIDPASERVIIRWMSGEHNGCTLAFGPDGMLYISTGDSSAPDPPDSKIKTGQDIGDLMASILRIDVEHAEGTNNYAVPRDNPFVRTTGARPEVWAFGFRNPFRMSFAPDGALWVGDVGFEQWEMVYRVRAGGNYGWPINEGPNLRVRADVKQGPGAILPPMHSVAHSDGASITGGRFYRGSKLPKLRGAYIYGDWETGKFWALRNDGDKLLSNDELCDTTLQPISFTEDRDGELLILDYHGGLYALAPHTAPPANVAFPQRLSESGVFADLAKLTPASGVAAYQPAVEMWSDYATVERHLGVPGSGVITTADGRQTIAGRMWDFPSNTVFTRTLTLELERGKPATARRIETQLLHFDGQTWNPYAFRWNTEQTDAELVPAAGTNDVFTLTDASAPGGRREVPWRFHSRAECLRCHNSWAGDTLSFNWLQLGGDERQRLAGLGVLRVKNPPRAREAKKLVNPYDPAQPLADRARSWLHVNCAGCHRNGAGGAVPAHLNFDKPLKDLRALDEKPTRGDFGIPDARVISPSDADSSTLLYRISTEGIGHMPHIGSRLVDARGAEVVHDWMNTLAGLAPSVPAQIRRALNHISSTVEWPTGPGADAVLEQTRNLMGQSLSNTHVALQMLWLTRVDTNPFPRRMIVPSAAAHTNIFISELFQQFLPPKLRRRVLGLDFEPQTILGLRGDAGRGKQIFSGLSQCSRCHISAGEGRNFGPDLTGAGNKYDRAQLLDSILNPSKLIAPEFKSITVTLRDDTELTGFVLKRNAAEIVLRDETLKEHTLKLSDVKEQRESALSAMPEGLLAPLTPQEAADLLEFLASSKAMTNQ